MPEMKTPEEIKRALDSCKRIGIHARLRASTHERCQGIHRQLESTYRQVSKALCGKDSATLEEILEAVNQLKRERDALLHDLREAEKTACDCSHCRHYARLENENLCEESDYMCPVCEKECRCKTCTEDLNHFEWRGVCAENTEGDP